MDRFDMMSAFVAVADLRGFAPAARKLRISPSAITRLVAALEQRLGLRLLHRTTRSVALTDAGERYIDRARRILSDLGEAEAAARAERTAPVGRFVVAAPSVFGRLYVAPLFSEFLARHPDVRGELYLSDRNVHLVDEGVDVAVRIGVLEDSTLRVRPIGATRRVLVASPAYLRTNPRLRSPADLARHRTIQFTSLTPLREWTFSRRARELRVPIDPTFVTDNADAAIAHAERGLGIALVLSYQAENAIKAGRLTIVLPRAEPAPIPIQLVYPSARHPSAAVRAFVEHAATSRTFRFLLEP